MAKIYTVTVENISAGPRGLHTVGGPKLLEKGESRAVRITEAELTGAKSTGYFRFSDELTEGQAIEPGQAPNVSLPPPAGEATIGVTVGGGAPHPITQLVFAADATLSPPVTGDGSGKALEPAVAAVHRGAGSYSVMRGDEEIVERLTKDEAKAFNEMGAQAQAAFIAERAKAKE